MAFIEARGYSSDIASGIIKALSAPSSGIPPGMLETMVKSLAGRWEVGEDAGLEALAKSVEQELARSSGRKTVRFTVTPPRGATPFEVKGFEGMSLKEVAEHGTGTGAELLREHIECACSGVMACSTCHIYIDPNWKGTVGDASEAEMDMLDLAHEPTDNSRLGCQIKLRSEFEGLQISIPDGANNMFDFIPFE